MNVNYDLLSDSQLPNNQGHWYSQLSVNQVATQPQLVQSPPPEQQQQHQQMLSTSQRKKKSRGNRKEQHSRRRLRKRNCEEETKASLTNARMEKNKQKTMNNTDVAEEPADCIIVPEDGQIQEWPLNDNNNNNGTRSKKRKRDASNKIQPHLNKSFSQLSISQGPSKKNKNKNDKPENNLSKVLNGIDDVDDNNNKQQDGLTESSMSTLLPRYLTVSDQAFKHMLSKAVPDGYKIAQWLDTAEKLQSVRQLAVIMNTACYLQLQQHLWQDYYNVGTTDGIWTSRVSKAKAKEHNTCPTYGRSQKLIEQRQKTIQHQMNRTSNELQQQLVQIPEWTDKAQPPINSTFLTTVIQACVDKGQQRLRAAFEHKQAMLKLDTDDHRLITAFYALQPNDEQIRLAKIIWQETADQCKAEEDVAILRKRVFLKRLPASFDTIVDQSIDHLRTLLADPNLDKDRRAILASHLSKTITQYKFNLVSLNIATVEDTARSHAKIATDTMNELKLLDGDPAQSCTEEIIKAIEARQENMKKRAQQFLKHQSQSFFEQAPTGVNDADSVPVGAKM